MHALAARRDDHPFFDFLLIQWGYHFGSLAIIPEAIPFNEVRTHFRSLLMVKNHENVAVYFRFYDPRVLRSFLPICKPDQIPEMFGPVKLFVVEGKEQTRVNRFWVESDQVSSKESTFVAAETL